MPVQHHRLRAGFSCCSRVQELREDGSQGRSGDSGCPSSNERGRADPGDCSSVDSCIARLRDSWSWQSLDKSQELCSKICHVSCSCCDRCLSGSNPEAATTASRGRVPAHGYIIIIITVKCSVISLEFTHAKDSQEIAFRERWPIGKSSGSTTRCSLANRNRVQTQTNIYSHSSNRLIKCRFSSPGRAPD
jgi:hypothetical protein